MNAHPATDGVPTRAGFVALVGRPNVGKSTLLNAFLGEKLSIVTRRAQTTRERVTGILTAGAVQLIFVDTPGLLEPTYALHRSMQAQALGALRDADVVLLLLDGTEPTERPLGEALEALTARGPALVVAINKIDAGSAAACAELARWSHEQFGVEPFRIAAVSGDGLSELRSALIDRLPLAPHFFPADEVAVQPMRFFVSELIRETIFEEYAQEVPYATVVRIEEYREGSTPLYIRATVYVERDTQKAIIVGKDGAGIRQLGARSRAKIEAFVGEQVYLDLWAKTLPGWRAKPSALQYLGYTPALADLAPAGRRHSGPRSQPPDAASGGRLDERGKRTR